MSAFLFQKLLSGTLDAFDGFLYVLPQDEAILHAGKHVVGNEQRDRGRFRRGRGFAVFRQHLPAQSHAPGPAGRKSGGGRARGGPGGGCFGRHGQQVQKMQTFLALTRQPIPAHDAGTERRVRQIGCPARGHDVGHVRLGIPDKAAIAAAGCFRAAAARIFAAQAALANQRAHGGAPAFAAAETETPPYGRYNGIAVIPVTGVITRQCERGLFGERLTQGQDEILRAVETARTDPEVRALFFRINSPGGIVAGIKELADNIAAGPKPAGAYADGQATSAAFWLASATGRIYAPATAMLGSVGVISEVVSLSSYLRRQGIDVQLLAAGRWKSAGHRAEPLDDERRAYLQKNVDAMHAIFKADVARTLA